MEDEEETLQQPKDNRKVPRDSHRGRNLYVFHYEGAHRCDKEKLIPVINLYMRAAYFYAFDPKLLTDLDQNSLADWELPFEQTNGFLYPVAQIPRSQSVFLDWQGLMKNFVNIHHIWRPFTFSAHTFNSSRDTFSGHYDIQRQKLVKLSLDDVVVPESE